MNFESLVLEQVQAGIEKRLSGGELLPPDDKKQRIRHELFTPDRKDDLLAALKLLDPQIMSSTQAVKAEDESEDETAEEELDDSDMDEEIE